MTKYLVVTGGSRGIGKAVLAKFMAAGWHGINISRTPCKLDGVTNLSIDLGNPNWREEHGANIQQLTLDASEICLVHNASTFYQDSIKTLTDTDLRYSLDINLVSALSLTQLLLPNMKSGSSIIYVGSTLSEIAVANRASYVISKHALVGMMRVTCQDLQGQGITTCCICPGFVNTSMLTEQVDKTILDAIIKSKVTAGRLIEPKEIADLIHFCAFNPVMNGAVLHANLGQISS